MSAMLCDARDKARLEARNAVTQLDYVAYLVNSVKARELRESHVLELQRLAVEGVYPCGGQYRHAAMATIIGGGHSLPEPSRVPLLVRDFVDHANSYRADYLHQSAYALWRVNWIHPFAGGNGRTARAVSYLLLCMHEGFMLPGVPTVPTILATTLRRQYLPALKEADEAETRGEQDLKTIMVVLARALERQFTAALEQTNRDLQALSLEAEELSRERDELRSQFARELTAVRSALEAKIEDRLDELVKRGGADEAIEAAIIDALVVARRLTVEEARRWIRIAVEKRNAAKTDKRSG